MDRKVCLAALTSVVLFASTTANAVALFFEKVQVKTASEATCLRFASDVARAEGFANVHKGPLEVAGDKSGAYVAITCVGRGQQQRAIAIVMVAAPDVRLAQSVAVSAAKRIQGITCIDSC